MNIIKSWNYSGRNVYADLVMRRAIGLALAVSFGDPRVRITGLLVCFHFTIDWGFAR